jgi:hypothetical protein
MTLLAVLAILIAMNAIQIQGLESHGHPRRPVVA